MIAFESRDLFAIKHQQTEFPNYTDWDRFAKAEYERLAMEEENGEDSEMIDAMEGWDSDQDGENREAAANANAAGAANAANTEGATATGTSKTATSAAANVKLNAG